MGISPLEASPGDELSRAAAAPPLRSKSRGLRDELASSTPVPLPAPSHAETVAPPEIHRELTVLVNVSDGGRISYQMLDSKTGRVILEIPPEEIRNAAESIAKLLSAAGETPVDVNS